MRTPTSQAKDFTDLNDPLPLPVGAAESFRDNGYIKLKNVLSPATIDHYGRAITDEVLRLNTNIKPLAERNTYQKAFLQVMNIWRHSEVVKQFVFSRRLARIAAELMGVAGVRMYHDQALYKEPGGGITPWHADQFYWPLDTDNTVTVWVPLQATPRELGPLAFSARSHRHKFGRDLEISDESEIKISKSVLESGLTLDENPFDLGEVSYHYGWTFHRAGPNQSDRPRAVMTIIYYADGARLIPPKYKAHEADLRTWFPGQKPGDLAASELNPLLYHADSRP